MKVIDLLNKIANGEEVPKKIKTEEDIFEYIPIAYDYKATEITINYWLFKDYVFGGNGNTLNDEIEIIEEDKKIKYCKGYECFDGIDDYIEHLRDKIDDLIDEVNKLKEE